MPSSVVVGNAAVAHMAAIAQHRVAVADLKHFFQPVGDKNRRDAVALEGADDGEEFFNLGAAQGGGWLIHDDELRFHGKGPGDLHHLLLGHGKIAHQGARVAVKADAVGQNPGLLLKLLAADEKLRARFAADEHVLGNGHVGSEGEFLIDGDNALGLGCLRAVEDDGFAIQFNAARIGGLGAGQNFQQG